ncbi:MAG TPA: DUF4105 domain-containing protein [Chitinophagaceae bacterium]|nr:DUF4105 domain-containing protein [Chitinophagaceae bacterium]
MKKLFVLLIASIFFHFLVAQDSDSNRNCRFQISLLTCTPGEELYSTFGHSALRVRDKSSGTDVIYNYGTFDFDDPNFYSKFTRGKLLYFVSVDNFENFLRAYEYEQRGITEQLLDLSCEEKEKLVAALGENAKEENKYYKYEFVLDNCTTRLRDMVFKNSGGLVVTKNIRPGEGITFRNLIHEYLDKSYQHWSKLGIDILLGDPVDRKISNNEAMFLPDYLLKGFDSTTIGRKPLVSGKKEILKATMRMTKAPLLSPFVVFAISFFVILLLSFMRNVSRFFSVFDFVLFFLSGALGILILFMWFGTDHTECKNNFNLAWAFPFHFLIVFFIFRKWTWMRYYFLGNAILLLLLLILWKWLPQEMNNALIPVVALLLLRSAMRYKIFSNGY